MLRSAALLASAASLVDGKVYFKEEFNTLDKWTNSEWKKSEEMGTPSLKTGKTVVDEEADKALAFTEDARFYATSATFDSFSNKGKTLIVQYQVKYEKDIECGGGYLKLGPKLEDAKKFGDPTPYNIMFGPDKCGYTKRTHLIFTYKGKNILKTVDLPYKQENDGQSYLYRLVVKPDEESGGKVEVFVNQESIYSGKIAEDWKMLEPKEIDDPDEKKPSDWVDDAMIDDPEEKKPDDWVEKDQAEIVDPEAKKPDDWDTEEDGDWEAPKIANPDFKGEWHPKKISNPAYKGVWSPKKIANPDFVDDKELYAFEDFSFVGLDVWQVKSDARIDNIIITDDEKEADKLAEQWKLLNEAELKATTTTTTTTPDSAQEPEEEDTDIAEEDEDSSSKDEDKEDL